MPQYHNATLQGKIEAAPEGPGCYLFHDARGNVIYVGKSIRLRERVRSYFTPSARDDERIAPLVREIRDVAYVQAETELDALMTEYRLIKRHRPWFNAQHIRSLLPHFILVALAGAYPTAVIVQAPAAGQCIGPFRDIHRAEEALRRMNRIWQTPLCGHADWPKAARPCLYHGMGRCRAPCAQAKDAAPSPAVAELAAFLAGDAQPARDRLRREMADMAGAMRFEAALSIKEALEGLEALARKASQGLAIGGDTHAIVLMRGFGEQALSAFYCKGGRVMGRLRLHNGMAAEDAAAALMQAVATNTLEPTPPGIEACICEISAWRRFTPLAPDASPQALREACATLLRMAADEQKT